MAQYIVEGKCFINGSVQDPAEDGRPPNVITVPDDFVPGFFLRPVDEPAKKAFAKYEASKLGLTAMVDGRRSVDPVERLPVKGK
jgi:hypothetical protein